MGVKMGSTVFSRGASRSMTVARLLTLQLYGDCCPSTDRRLDRWRAGRGFHRVALQGYEGSATRAARATPGVGISAPRRAISDRPGDGHPTLSPCAGGHAPKEWEIYD